jgi:hypothetical protein
LKTFHDTPIASLIVLIGGALNSDVYWDAMAYVVSQFGRMQQNGLAGYSYIVPETTYNGTTLSGCLLSLLMPNGTIAEAEAAIAFIGDYLNTRWPGQLLISVTPTQYANLYGWYQVNKNQQPVGYDNAIGSRLLGAQELSQNLTVIRKVLQDSIPLGGVANINIIAGPGVWNATPAGGSNSVNPVWRKTYVEYGMV